MNGCLHGISKSCSEPFDSKGSSQDSANSSRWSLAVGRWQNHVARSLAFLCDLCSCSLGPLRLKAFDFAGGATKNGRVFLCRDSRIVRYFPRFTAFFNSAPGLNFATRRAAILIVAPVLRLRPLGAFRCETVNLPNPVRTTRSPFLHPLVVLST